MMMFWVEIVDADGKVLLTSDYYTYRKHAEAKRTELQRHPILQSQPGVRVRIKSGWNQGATIQSSPLRWGTSAGSNSRPFRTIEGFGR